MSEFGILSLFEISREAVRLLILFSLQAIFLLGLIWILTKLFRNYSATIRHNLWLTGLLAIAVLPFWAFFVQFFPASNTGFKILPQFGETPGFLSLFADEKSVGVFTFSQIGWLDWIALIAFVAWLVGVFVCLVRLVISYKKLKRIRRRSQMINADEKLHQFLQLSTKIELYRSTEISNPLLNGVFRPAILLPAEIETWADEEEIRAIIRHEIAHFERRDYLLRPLQALLASVFFFHPLVRFAVGQMSFEREAACDEKVLSSGIAPENYKKIILKVAEQDVLTRESFVLTFNPAKKILSGRIYKIMNNKNKSLSKSSRYILTASTLFLLAFAAWFATPNTFVAAQSQSSVSANADDEEFFKNLYEEMRQIILKGDREAFEKFFAEDYTAVSSRGTEMTKKQVVDTHIQKPNAETKLETVNFSDFKVRVSGDAAVVTYSAEMSGIMKGKKFSQQARITDVWEMKDGKWLSVASHASAVR